MNKKQEKELFDTNSKNELDAFIGYAYERHGYPDPEEAKTWSYKDKAMFHAKCDAYEIDPDDRFAEQQAINSRMGKNI